MSYRILVTGSRDWTDKEILYIVLRDAFVDLGRDRSTVLVHGDARGADRMAKTVWNKQGLLDEPHPAKWSELGNRAGPVRNAEMVDLGADICLAFPLGESRGTRGCMKLAKEAGIPVKLPDGSFF